MTPPTGTALDIAATVRAGERSHKALPGKGAVSRLHPLTALRPSGPVRSRPVPSRPDSSVPRRPRINP